MKLLRQPAHRFSLMLVPTLWLGTGRQLHPVASQREFVRGDMEQNKGQVRFVTTLRWQGVRKVDAHFHDVAGHAPPLALEDTWDEEDPMSVRWILDPFSEVAPNYLSGTLGWGCPDGDAVVDAVRCRGALVGQVLEVLRREMKGVTDPIPKRGRVRDRVKESLVNPGDSEFRR